MDSPIAKPRILVVDDDLHVLNMLEIGLHNDFHIVTLSRSEKALEIVKSDRFDLVITDVMMPIVSGFELLREVKETDQLVEVILLTGELPDKAKPAIAALHNGAHDYLLKPVKICELKAAIHKALEQRRLRLENTNLLQELVQMANLDHLTGLSNRRHFCSQFYQEFRRCDRYGRSLGCIMLDVDRFKKVNDHYGHRWGDMVLQGVGKLMLKHFRSLDLKCRYGGEEFVLVLPETEPAGTLAVAEKLRRLIENDVYELESQLLRVTASLGVATYEERNFQSADELLNAADLALLTAKREGRNCIRCHEQCVAFKVSQPVLTEI